MAFPGDLLIGAGTAEASYRYLYPREGYALRVGSEATGPDDAADAIMELLEAGGGNES